MYSMQLLCFTYRLSSVYESLMENGINERNKPDLANPCSILRPIWLSVDASALSCM